MRNETLSPVFARHIRKHFPFVIGQKMLLAVSGGIDSMAMLHLFLETKEALKVTPVVAHINHNLRPDSGRDAQFVDNFCQRAGVEFHLAEIPREYWTDKKGGREDIARRERYRILQHVARKCRITHTATAHHRDDQVETVLMRILDRGTGLQGLGGIPEIIKRGSIIYIRPLLAFYRRQLRSHMGVREWVEDGSNNDIDIRRNLFRHEVIPYLERTVSPNISEHIAQLSDTAEDYNGVLTVALDRFWDSHRRSLRARSYLVSQEESVSLTDRFWLSALAHLVRRERGYTFGARTLKDMVGFLRSATKKAYYDPLTIEKNNGKIIFFFS